jgi:flagellar FliL protein
MARRKKTEDGAEGSADGTGKPPKKGKSNLLPAVVVAIGLLGGGYFMSSGKGGKAAAAVPGPGPASSTTVEGGAIVKLDAITLNLADGRFLKVGLALQLAKAPKKIKPDTLAATDAARALDLGISVLGSKSYTELATSSGREAAKTELASKVKDAYGGDVVGIFFTEFVMQ